jgi:hypothetical protein
MYQITPKPGMSNGAYGLDPQAWEPGSDRGIETCTTDFLVVLGSGVPNYEEYGSCIGAAAVSSQSTPYPPGYLVAASFGVSFTNG